MTHRYINRGLYKMVEETAETTPMTKYKIRLLKNDKSQSEPPWDSNEIRKGDNWKDIRETVQIVQIGNWRCELCIKKKMQIKIRK